MTGSTETRIVPLDQATPAEWMALSSAAHWNQTEADWRTMLALGRGWGLREGAEGAGSGSHGGNARPTRDGRLVASTLVLPFGGLFAWISMVLVLPEARGRGHASRLLGEALGWLADTRLLPVLDATPAGRPVYLKQGFVDDWSFARWRRSAEGPPPALTSPIGGPDSHVRRLRDTDWPAIAALDEPAFGASRLPLLQRMWQRRPTLGWVKQRDTGEGEGGPSGLRAFLLCREGRTAMQLGPLVATQAEDAVDLLQAAFDALVPSTQSPVTGTRFPPLIVDLREAHPLVQAWLERHGFTVERPFTRMVRGAPKAPGDPGRIVLVSGPELG